ncbi:MAG: hypothetical protein ABSE99_14990 [Terracidiphilus sp.]|jgi:hypothetical protein
MRLFRSARWLLLALLLCAIPASSYAGVFISVGFAPPVLPVYVQPVCPQPGLMWTPGYWAYGDDGYYWVPGAWVPAPYVGALWTPGYWGWSGGMFVFHDGYWGPHVGYYGGVNYGFGYGGIGFAGGMWRGGVFAYNAAVVHVDIHDSRFVHSTYQDRMAVERGFVARDSHVAYSGGPGGIRHDPSPEERIAEHEQHVAKTSFQAQHESSARADRTSYARSNGGHPQNLAVARPLPAETHSAPAARPTQQSRPAVQQSQGRPIPQPQSRPAPQAQSHSAQQSHPAPQQHSAPRSEPKEKERK